MSTTIIVCGVVGALIGYLLMEIREVNEKAEWQYIQCKLSNVQTNLSLVDYLLKRIGK